MVIIIIIIIITINDRSPSKPFFAPAFHFHSSYNFIDVADDHLLMELL